MQTVLYMAISIDGKTTQQNENVDWVTEFDIQRMDKLMNECGVMLMGSGTYRSFGDELPNDQALMVVMTSDEKLLEKKQENVVFVNEKPENVLKLIERKGFDKVLLAGGEELNTTFLTQDLIDEIRLLIEPIVIGTGKSLFKDSKQIKKFKTISAEQFDTGVLEVIYRRV